LKMVSEDQQCAGWLEVFYNGTWGSVCHSPMEDITVSMICRQLGCGESGILNSSVALREGSRPQCVDGIQCQKTDTSLWLCPSDPWNYTSCSPKEVVSRGSGSALEFLALRMVSEDQQCAGWLEVFYSGTWGSVCHSPMEDITVSMICRQLGCGESGILNSSVALREGSRPQWVDGIQCQKTDTSLWQCPSDPWNYTSCYPKEEVYISCAGGRHQSCPTAAPCTGMSALPPPLWLPGAPSSPQGRGGLALEAVRAAAFGPGSGSIWLDEVWCRGQESSLWDCAAEPWGQSDCKHEEDAGVRCSAPQLPPVNIVPGFLGRVDIQSLGTCSVDSLTMKESKELEEPLTGGGEPEQYVGELLCLGPLGQRVLMPR
ncbi:hypothetical protein M91_02071, partial [Bos mutus]